MTTLAPTPQETGPLRYDKVAALKLDRAWGPGARQAGAYPEGPHLVIDLPLPLSSPRPSVHEEGTKDDFEFYDEEGTQYTPSASESAMIGSAFDEWDVDVPTTRASGQFELFDDFFDDRSSRAVTHTLSSLEPDFASFDQQHLDERALLHKNELWFA